MPSSPAAVPTVVLALPESLVWTALATALQDRCDVVAVVQSWDDFENALAEHRPAVVVLDIAVGTASALAHLSQLTAIHHDTRFMLCTRHLDPVVSRSCQASRALAGALLCSNGDWTEFPELWNGQLFSMLLSGRVLPSALGSDRALAVACVLADSTAERLAAIDSLVRRIGNPTTGTVWRP